MYDINMNTRIVIALLVGIILGQNLPIATAHAQSNSDTGNRIVKALEDISQTLKSINQKIK